MIEADGRLVDALVATEPRLRPLLDAHVAMFGELLPYVFLADVARWVAGESRHPASVRPLLDLLDAERAAAGPDTRNLIDVGFLESIDPRECVVPLLGPRLRAAFDDGLGPIGGPPDG